MGKTVLTVSLHYILTEKVVTPVCGICRILKMLRQHFKKIFLFYLPPPVKFGLQFSGRWCLLLIESSTMPKNCILSK